MKPDNGTGTISVGIEALAESIRWAHPSAVHRSGEVGQQDTTANGFSRSASAEPRTASSRSCITDQPSTEKAPVTTGFSHVSNARKSR